MRWFTCTPVVFGGGADFFARDSGLVCRGFQELGVDSRAVMPGDRQPEDDADLIRTEFENLESADWWRAHQLDGVVLYAWGSPKFRRVAAAIRAAGIFLVLNQDNGGLVSLRAGFWDWLCEQWILAGQGRGLRAWLRFSSLMLRGVSIGVLRTDRLRAEHLKHGHVIACVSPKAAGYYRKLCGIYGGYGLARRVVVVPHAVESRFCYHGELKRRQVACVGRWADVVQKRPWRLMEVIGALVAADENVVVEIVGTVTHEMAAWQRSLIGRQGDRVHLRGCVDRDGLAAILRESQVFYSPSAFESFGIAAAEALCSGCSVVAGRAVSMASFEWFIEEGSGTLAEANTQCAHIESLERELASWDRGDRNPAGISAVWSGRLHAANVASRILDMAEHRGDAAKDAK